MIKSAVVYFLSKTVFKAHTWIAFLIFVVLALAYRTWRSRIHNGDYEFVPNSAGCVFKSELGEFVFDKEKRTFVATYINKKQVTLSFNDIRNIEIITEDIDAMFEEIVLEDWSMFIDTDSRYRDVVKKYSIAVITKNFQRYPLIVMSQYTVKDFLAFGLQAQFDFLMLVGLHVPLDFYAKKIYDKFQEILGKEFSFDRDKLPYSFGEGR